MPSLRFRFRYIASMVPPARTVKPRRWYLNLLWAVAGGVATIAIGVTTNVISYQLTEGAVTVAPDDGDAACPELPTFDDADGTERVTVLVRDPFTECWNDALDSVRPGDEFEMRVEYQNNTATQQNDIMLTAVLPEGFEYINGSSVKASSSTGGGYVEWSDDIVRASAGLNGGDYRPRGNVFIKFKLRMTEALAPLCGVQAWAPGVRVVTPHRPDGMLASAGVMTVRPPCE